MPTHVAFKNRAIQQGKKAKIIMLTLGAPGITLATAFLHAINSSIKL